jgi:hypothetical protein
MQTQNIYIALTPYIYIYITIYLCFTSNLTCENPTKKEQYDYKITYTNHSTWDIYNLKKQKFRRLNN